jgi:hypothetical protein
MFPAVINKDRGSRNCAAVVRVGGEVLFLQFGVLCGVFSVNGDLHLIRLCSCAVKG